MVATNAKGLQLGANCLKKANRIALIGNGGNLAIAQHMASDIYRHTNKFCFAPDAINTTALGGDGDWKKEWLDYAVINADLIIGITCRVNSPLVLALEKLDVEVLLLAPDQHEFLNTIVINSVYYHEFEINALSTIYLMMAAGGWELPKLPNQSQRYDDITEGRDNIYCIDIDGTLTEPHDGSPWDAVPRMDRIARVNEWYDNGYTIYLMTARGFIHSTSRYPQDITSQQAEADYHCRSRTEAQLKKWGVKYHKLFFGKPRANKYIDDRGAGDDFLD
tara:strand:- start:95 stop:925 length:831 start_codon:yes stop_codon:yes gene_type:complete